MSDEPVYARVSDEPVYVRVSDKHRYESESAKAAESFGSLKLQVSYLDEAVYDLSLKLNPFMVPEMNASPAPSSNVPENCSPYYAELHELADRIERIRVAILIINGRIELP